MPQSRAEAETEEETLPAAAYAMLELCQRHLAAVKSQLVQVWPHLHKTGLQASKCCALEHHTDSECCFASVSHLRSGCRSTCLQGVTCRVSQRVASAQAPGQRQRPQKKVAQGPKGRARGGASLAATRSLPARQRSSMLGAPAKYGFGGYGGGGALERSASFAKRRRTEYDAGDMVSSALAGAASVKFVERVQVRACAAGACSAPRRGHLDQHRACICSQDAGAARHCSCMAWVHSTVHAAEVLPTRHR